jgi:hypothetical protein
MWFSTSHSGRAGSQAGPGPRPVRVRPVAGPGHGRSGSGQVSGSFGAGPGQARARLGQAGFRVLRAGPPRGRLGSVGPGPSARRLRPAAGQWRRAGRGDRTETERALFYQADGWAIWRTLSAQVRTVDRGSTNGPGIRHPVRPDRPVHPRPARPPGPIPAGPARSSVPARDGPPAERRRRGAGRIAAGRSGRRPSRPAFEAALGSRLSLTSRRMSETPSSQGARVSDMRRQVSWAARASGGVMGGLVGCLKPPSPEDARVLDIDAHDDLWQFGSALRRRSRGATWRGPAGSAVPHRRRPFEN